MIQKLESAGLGYHVRADETEERLGMICSFSHTLHVRLLLTIRLRARVFCEVTFESG